MICFLTYLNRSGSTLLAKKLDHLRDVSVSIEMSFGPGYLKGNGLEARNGVELDHCLDDLYGHQKFVEWNIERSVLRKELERGGFPVTFRKLLPAILRLYSRGKEVEVYVYKQNMLFLHCRELRVMFPRSKFIFIGRDPRAIYSSQKRCLDSAGRRMAGSVAEFAAHYRNTRHFIATHLEGKDYFKFVKYEDLLLDEEGEMKRLRDFLGVSGEVDEGKGDYFTKIPASQKHLHQNLKENSLKKNRIQAWRKELGRAEIVFLQWALADILDREGYGKSDVGALKFWERIKFLWLTAFYSLRYAAVARAKKILGAYS